MKPRTNVARELVLHGRVQGVCFRAHARAAADRAGAAGWAENRSDGTLAIHLEGSEQAVTAAEEECRNGPAAARIERVEEADVGVAGLTRFETR
jgi:acylphosphatase